MLTILSINLFRYKIVWLRKDRVVLKNYTKNVVLAVLTFFAFKPCPLAVFAFKSTFQIDGHYNYFCNSIFTNGFFKFINDNVSSPIVIEPSASSHEPVVNIEAGP